MFSPIDIEKKKLDWNRAQLQTQKAKKDRALAALDAKVKEAEKRAAEIGMHKRTIRAPFDGEVQQLLVHESEWVNPGDPLLQVVKFDVMWVECYVSAKDYDPAELQGKPVTVSINLARNREAKVPGRIIYASQTVLDTTETYGDYLVRAEVQNQRTGDFWLVRPGLHAVHDDPREPTGRRHQGSARARRDDRAAIENKAWRLETGGARVVIQHFASSSELAISLHRIPTSAQSFGSDFKPPASGLQSPA